MKALTSGRARLVLLTLPLVAALIAACDQTFEPLSPGRQALVSVFGYLDPSADTQWIRVMPIRPLKTTSPDPFEGEVTLTEVGTGRIITLRDSLVRFSAGASTDDSATAFVHDFWTTERIAPGARYHFAAIRPGELAAEAVVDVPERFVVTVSLHQSNRPSDLDFASVSGATHLPFSARILFFADGCGLGKETLSFQPARADGGTVVLRPIGDTASRRGNGECGRPTVTRRHLWVAASDSTWPVPQTVHALGLGASERSSNISNAVGFLGGVLTTEVPYTACTYARQMKWPDTTSFGIPGPEQKYFPDWCELQFDSVAASTNGRVIETRCGDGPVRDATVRFTELNDSARTQFGMTASDGVFEFGALRPGVRYNVYVHAELVPVGGGLYANLYSTVDDTVTFSPGEHRTRDFAIQRQIPCDQHP